MTASRARNLADIVSGGFSVGAASSFHGFVFNADGTLDWTYGEDVTALQNSDQEDLYDLVIVGSDDQTYSVDANGYFICTIEQ
jgi:hypothetical protein